MRGSLVAISASARCQGPRFYPGQGRNLDRVFCTMRTAVPPLGPQHWVPEPVPSLRTHLNRPTSAVKKKHDSNPMADNSEWKTPSMEGEGKDNGHQYWRKPRTPEPIPIAGKLT